MPTCFITGTTHGIGTVTAREIARTGHRVIMGVRDVVRGAALARDIVRTTGNDAVSVLPLDLADFASVRTCAARLLAETASLDLLINNAGTMSARRELTPDGHELMFATNHLGPFLLTHLLLPRLRESAPARIVNVASRAHGRGHFDFDDLSLARGFAGMAAYGRSKLGNVLFTLALSRRLAGSGVTVNCLHPGVVATNIIPANSPLLSFAAPLAKLFMLSPERGARCTLKLALSPEVAGISGAYFDARGHVTPPAPAARDLDLQERLWRVSAELTGIA
jgi:retinol dehydrogenase-12/retinol dehydrogenase-13